jgi:uncharacterized membrane protein YjgN (DUF898 family)
MAARPVRSCEALAMNESVPAVPIVPLAPTAPAVPLAFSGERPDFRRLVLRGALLELVTVGFYRFWLATDMRRHLWSNTSVNGDAAEYLGTAKELLLGFLFALAILAPIYLIYFLIGLEAERWKAFASIPLVLFYYVFAQFALYRARRYRLTRTVWRGARFWMAGSGWAYAGRAVLWTLITILTLGLALPWRQAALERYKMRHVFYGQLRGRFDATGWAFFKRGWVLWLVLVILVLAPYLLILMPYLSLLRPTLTLTPALMVLAYVLQVLALPFVYGMYKGIEWQWWISGIRLGDVSFTTTMSRAGLVDVYWKVVGWNLLLLIVLLIWIAGVFGIFYGLSDVGGTPQQRMLAVSQQLSFLIASGFGYVLAVLAMWAIMRVYLIRDVWQRVVASMSVHNLAAADNAVVQGEMVGALGEGFADSLDVVGF